MNPMSGGANMSPHKPTLAWAIGAVVIVVLVYHFGMKKR